MGFYDDLREANNQRKQKQEKTGSKRQEFIGQLMSAARKSKENDEIKTFRRDVTQVVPLPIASGTTSSPKKQNVVPPPIASTAKPVTQQALDNYRVGERNAVALAQEALKSQQKIQEGEKLARHHMGEKNAVALAQAAREQAYAAAQPGIARADMLSKAYAMDGLSDLAERERQKKEALRQTYNAMDAETFLKNAGESVGRAMIATPDILLQTSKQAAKSSLADSQNEEVRALYEQVIGMENTLPSIAAQYGMGSKEYEAAQKQYQTLKAELDEKRDTTPVSQDTFGMQQMKQANEARQRATEGLITDTQKALANASISVAQNAPWALIGTLTGAPAIGATVLGAMSGASKMQELSERGIGAGEALVRGGQTAAIETLTEKLPLDKFVNMIKAGEKVGALDIIKQVATEGTEEGVSYLLNYAADKVSGDEEAKFNYKELLDSVIGGAISGAMFGTAGNILTSNKPTGRTIRQAVQERIAQREQGQRIAEAIQKATEQAGQRTIEQTKQEFERQAAPQTTQAPATQGDGEMGDAGRKMLQNKMDEWTGKNAMFRALDEKTGKTLPEAQQKEVDAKQADFRRLYEEAKAGAALETLQSDALTEEEVTMAYRAGTSDAQTEAQNWQENERPAAMRAKDPKLVRDEAYQKAKLTRADERRLDALAKTLGVNIAFTDEIRVGDNQLANAQIAGDTITVALNTEQPLYTAVMHEAVHRIRALDENAYTGLRDTVFNILSNDAAQYGISYLTRQQAYGTQDVNTISEEMVADAIGNAFGNEAFLNRMVQENRGVMERMRDQIHDIVIKLERQFGGEGVKVKGAQAEEFRELYAMTKDLDDRLTKALMSAEGGLVNAQITEEGQKNTADEGGGKYSLKAFPDGRRFVDVEVGQEQFEGLTPIEMNALAKSIIKQKYKGKVVGIDNAVFVNGNSAEKYVYFPPGTKDEIIEAKARASTELDNLIDAGTNFRTEPDGKDGHVHLDAINGFSYFDTIFKVGDNYYKGIINIKNIEKGKLLWGVTKTENITQDIHDSYGETPAVIFLRDASMKMLSQQTPKVNTQQSLQIGDTVEQVRQQLAGMSEAEILEALPPQMRQYVDNVKRTTPALDKLGIRIHRPIAGMNMADQIRQNEQVLRDEKNALAETKKKLYPTDAELRFAEDLANGIYTEEDIPPRMDRNTVTQLAEQMGIVQSLETGGIDAKKVRDKWAFRGRIEKMLPSVVEKIPAKGKSTLNLGINTMLRNSKTVFGEYADEVNEELFQPILDNEAERLRFVNSTIERLSKFKLNKKESDVLQRVLEKAPMDPDLASDKAVDMDKVQRAAKEYRNLYNNFYDAINDMLVTHGYKPIGFIQDYAPHMQDKKTASLASRMMQRLGFGDVVSTLPTAIAGRTDEFRPGKQFNPFFLHRTGVKTAYDAATGMEQYLHYMSNVVYHMDDIQKLREFENMIREQYLTEEDAEYVEELKTRKDRYENAVAGKKAEQGYLTKEDYNRLEKEYDFSKEKEEELQRMLYDDPAKKSALGAYATVLQDYTNKLAGKQTKVDRAVEYGLGRKILNLGNELTSAFVKNKIMGNLSSALNQTVQLPMVTAEVGESNMLAAIKDVMTGEVRKSGFDNESVFLTGKRGVGRLHEATLGEKVYDVAGIAFEAVDDFTSRVIVRAKYLQELKNGHSHEEALKLADDYANRAVGSRMKGAKPIRFEDKNMFSKLLTSFQLEVANGWKHITEDIPDDIRYIAKTEGKGQAAKRAATIAFKVQIYSFLANLILESLTGRDPVPYDLIGLTADFMTGGYGLTKDELWKAMVDGKLGEEEFDVLEAAAKAGARAANDIPYLSNVASAAGYGSGRPALQNFAAAGKGIVTTAKGAADLIRGEGVDDDGEALTEEQVRERGRDRVISGLLGTAGELVPMGSQIKKTGQGILMAVEGGAYTGEGEDRVLMYPFERSPQNYARAIAFGRASTPEARKYYDKDMSKLGKADTIRFVDATDAGISPSVAYDKVIIPLRGISAKKDDNDEVILQKMENIFQKIDNVQELSDAEKTFFKMAYLTDANKRKAEELKAYGISDEEFIDFYSDHLRIERTTAKEDKREAATELSKKLYEMGLDERQAKAVLERYGYPYVVYAQPYAYRFEYLSDAGKLKYAKVKSLGRDIDKQTYTNLYDILTQQKKKDEVIADAVKKGYDPDMVRDVYTAIKSKS